MDSRRISYMLVFALVAAMACASQAGASPVNLLSNGDFETGIQSPVTGNGPSALGSWGQYHSAGTVTSWQATSPVWEGSHSAHISGNTGAGLYQYPGGWEAGTYTVSGWVYVTSGAAHLGLAWNGGSNTAYGPTVNATSQWTFVEFTYDVPSNPHGLNGPLVYSASDRTDFYADAIWLNFGADNTSPFRPVPIPGAVLLLGPGLVVVGAITRRFKK